MARVRVAYVLWVWAMLMLIGLTACEWGVKQWQEPEPPPQEFVDTPGSDYAALRPYTITFPAHGCNTGDIFVADEHGNLVCEAQK